MSAEDHYSACESTLDEVIDALIAARDGGANPKALVLSWDPDAGKPEPVTGFIIGGLTIELQTDEP